MVHSVQGIDHTANESKWNLAVCRFMSSSGVGAAC